MYLRVSEGQSNEFSDLGRLLRVLLLEEDVNEVVNLVFHQLGLVKKSKNLYRL